MTPGRRLAAAMVAVWGAAIPLLGPTPAVAAAPAAAPAPAPVAFTLRYSTVGWAGLRQTGAAQLACAGDAQACAAATVPTTWVDTDDDPATINSSTASLTVPAGATIGWGGLYWSGERAEPGSGSGTGTGDGAPNRVRVRVGRSDPVTVTAGALTEAAHGFQAYADITALLSPHQTDATELPITVADLRAALGPDRSAGWTALLAYSYPDGPDPQAAPTYRALRVFDGITAGSGAIRLDGLVTPASGPVDGTVSVALAAPAQLSELTINNADLPRPPTTGLGYHLGTAPLPANAIKPGATAATLHATAGSYVAAVLAISTQLPASVDLAVATTVTPSSAPVGTEATLTITIRNDATLPTGGVVVTTRLPTGLTLVGTAPSFQADTGAWSVGHLAAGGTAALVLRVRVTAAGSLVTTAEVTASDLPARRSDGDPVSSATLTGTEPPPTPAQTLAPQVAAVPPEPDFPVHLGPAVLIGVGLFALGLLMISIVVLRNRAA